MALPPLAEIADLANWLGEEIENDNQRAEALIAGASRLVRRETSRQWLTAAGELDDGDPTIDEDALEVAQQVVVAAAARLWANPTGVIHETEGPFSARWAEQVAEGLYLTDTEKGLIGPYSTSASSAVWTLATTRGDTADTEYVDTVYAPGMEAGAPIPYRDPE